jgi:hypothetical protein
MMHSIQFRFHVSLVIFGVVFIAGIIGFMVVEGLSLGDAFYFNIVTMATVGYGDIFPKTTAGKMLAVLVIVMGVGSFLGVVANATEMMIVKQENKGRLEKMNMIIGVFFSTVGNRLLADFTAADPELEQIRQNLFVSNNWSDRDFTRVHKEIKGYSYAVDMARFDLLRMKGFLQEQRDVLLRLLENPSLLEHESFSQLLLAVSHLAEEMACRKDVTELPESDVGHIRGDIRRVYVLLVKEWLHYMKYLKTKYPYLFSLALRMNPFDQEASPIVR